MKNITFIALLILGALTLMHCGGDDAPQPDPNDSVVTITASDFTATIDENPDAMAAIGTVTASASDNSTLTYSISTQSVAGALAIDASTGALTVADASAFDYETNTSITGTYKATSGDVEEEGDITITINDVDDPVTITASDFTADIDENPDAMAAIGTVTASASDNSTLTYSISTQSVAGALAIDASTGALTVADASAFDYETNKSITGNYKATSGDVEEEGSITITINDVDEANPGAFILTYRTTTANESVTIGTFSNLTYDFNVDWGDGTPIENNQTGDVSHTFASSGDHQITITGDYPAFGRGTPDNARKLISIDQWGSQVWLDMQAVFLNCSNLVSVGSDAPDLSQVTSMENMFGGATNFNSPIGHWDVSNVTNMNFVFNGANMFDQDLSSWDVSNVTTMINMFVNTKSFNGDISTWDVSNVTNTGGMFNGATAFNQDISDWDVSNVTNMSFMFTGASSFNQPLEDWDVSSVENMANMFQSSVFNQPLDKWDVSSVTNMSIMFSSSQSFNQNLKGWNVANVTNCAGFRASSSLDLSNAPNFTQCTP